MLRVFYLQHHTWNYECGRRKASFLKKIILGNSKVRELPETLAFELLSHMKGGPSVDVLLDLALGNDEAIARKASEVLKTQVFLYEADLDRLRQSYNAGNTIAKDVLRVTQRQNFYKFT